MTPEFMDPPPGFDAEAYLQVVSDTMGLTIDPAHRANVLLFLRYSACMGNLLMSFELDDQFEAAPVFTP